MTDKNAPLTMYFKESIGTVDGITSRTVFAYSFEPSSKFWGPAITSHTFWGKDATNEDKVTAWKEWAERKPRQSLTLDSLIERRLNLHLY